MRRNPESWHSRDQAIGSIGRGKEKKKKRGRGRKRIAGARRRPFLGAAASDGKVIGIDLGAHFFSP